MVILTSFFPLVYPDELLYSILARYHLYVGNISTKSTIEELYGRKSICAVTGLPAHIEKISQLTRGMFTSDEILLNHTLFPYFAFFLSGERLNYVEEAMVGALGNSVYARIGLLSTTVKQPPTLRFCAQCLTDDEARYGVPYWHRSHQLPGVLICHKHDLILLESSVLSTQRRNKHEFIALSSQQLGKEVVDKVIFLQNKELFLYIAVQSNLLLTKNYREANIDILRSYYRSSLYEKSLITPSGNIRFKRLNCSFTEVIKPNILQLFYSTINDKSDHTWLHKLVRGNHSVHPLRHLLLLFFLNETFHSLIDKHTTSFHPFGNGPWPCLNTVCKQYKREVITHCEVSRCSKTRLPVGTFKCSCGFIYSRRGPDTLISDRYKIGRIKVFGHEWERKFEQLIAENRFSSRQMGEILGVHFSTIAKKISRLKSYKTPIDDEENSNNVDVYKERWLDLRSHFPHFTVTELRTRNPQVYSWLYRNSREWLFSLKYNKKVKKKFSKVDWEERDKKVYSLIPNVVKEIGLIIDPPVRVTVSEIGRRIGNQSLLEKKMNLLPLSKQLILEVVESREQFQIRRIKMAAQKIYNQGFLVQSWRIVRIAGLRKEVAEKFEKIIQVEIEYYNKLNS